MAHMVILVGNIGTGKSTFAQTYADKGYVVISKDSFRYGIGNGSYIFNTQYEPIMHETEMCMLYGFLDIGANLVIDDGGCVNARIRNRFIDAAKRHEYKTTVIEFPILPREIAVERRMQNPHSVYNEEIGLGGRELWEHVWDKLGSIYDAPNKKTEMIDEIIGVSCETIGVS